MKMITLVTSALFAGLLSFAVNADDRPEADIELIQELIIDLIPDLSSYWISDLIIDLPINLIPDLFPDLNNHFILSLA